MNSLQDLKEILEEEGLMNSKSDFESRYNAAFANARVRDLLELETPPITDLTDLLQIEGGGKVYAVRMDLFSGVQGLKKPVVAGLILRGVLQGKIPTDAVDTLIDGGNMNTGYALGYYGKKFGMNVVYIMSRFFPTDLTDRLVEEDGPNFKVVRAPANLGVGMEREFYGYLFDLKTGKANLNEDVGFDRKKSYFLWHAKYGGESLHPLGMEIARKLENFPDYIVVPVGAGSTLECLCVTQDYLKKKGYKSKIVIPEHIKSPIFAKTHPYIGPLGTPLNILGDEWMARFNPNSFRQPPQDSVPHSVLGPHFDEPNPLIPQKVISKIDYVQKYSDQEWMRMSHYLESHGFGVGNSSAANIAVAANLANQGSKVLTVIFEPLRGYYKSNIIDLPWLFREETIVQRIALRAASIAWLTIGAWSVLNSDPRAPWYMIN